jgi:biopolymer transport protein ExbD
MLLPLSLLAGVFGCDDQPPPKNPFERPADAPKPLPKVDPPKAKGPPELEVDAISPKVGFTRVLLDKPTERAKLTAEVEKLKDQYQGRDVTIKVDRNAQPAWVIALVEDVAAAGAGAITIQTQTRADLPASVVVTPQGKAPEAPPCSVVATVLADRGTAVWKLSGGVASKRTKGFAGPDLTMTSDTMERIGKACKNSSTIFVSGGEGVEWGHVYDLAGAAKKIESPRFETVVLLREAPVAGRPVKL